jgi:hypothetical protein
MRYGVDRRRTLSVPISPLTGRRTVPLPAQPIPRRDAVTYGVNGVDTFLPMGELDLSAIGKGLLDFASQQAISSNVERDYKGWDIYLWTGLKGRDGNPIMVYEAVRKGSSLPTVKSGSMLQDLPTNLQDIKANIDKCGQPRCAAASMITELSWGWYAGAAAAALGVGFLVYRASKR